MKYEVRYMVDAEEHSVIVDVDNAAEAAEQVKQDHPHQGETFELIQVHLLDELAPDHVETISEF